MQLQHLLETPATRGMHRCPLKWAFRFLNQGTMSGVPCLHSQLD